MKRLALAGIILLSAVPVYLITGSAVAGKGKAAKASPATAMTGTDTARRPQSTAR
jgi:hypothetical protein